MPDSLALVVAHAMLKDPAQRYGSADEFAADLDRVRRGLVPVAATAAHTAIVPREPTEFVPAVEATRIAPRAGSTPLLSGEQAAARGPTPRKRSRWPWLLVLLLLLAVGALAAFALGGVPGDDSPTTTGEPTTTRHDDDRVASHTLDDLEGQTYLEAKSTLRAIAASTSEGAARARRHARGRLVVARDPPAGSAPRRRHRAS